MIQQTVRVLWNSIECSSGECSGYFRMGLECDGYADAGPGQFVMVRSGDNINPLLRRPFSIHRLIREKDRVSGIELLYKIVGTGTQFLSSCGKGHNLDLLGPLGNSFSISPDFRRIFIVAGGIGVAPMFFLTSVLGETGVNLGECKVFIGGRSKDDLLCMNDFFNIGMETVHITTDDGSAGIHDRVTGPLESAIIEGRPDMIYACGPQPMLKNTAAIAEKYEVPCQISIETMMACGIGACLGCAVNNKNAEGKYLHACANGPVFNSGTVAL